VPFWWTDVHGVKLQVAGVAAGADRVEIEDGPAGAAFVARYWLAGELLAVAAVDQPRVVAAARRELESTGKEGSIAA
jgi:hypothetical protein